VCRTGKTDFTGKVRFLEGVGPSPCNPLRVELIGGSQAADLGCVNGGEKVEHTFILGSIIN
jgi:hypothetical protein